MVRAARYSLTTEQLSRPSVHAGSLARFTSPSRLARGAPRIRVLGGKVRFPSHSDDDMEPLMRQRSPQVSNCELQRILDGEVETGRDGGDR